MRGNGRVFARKHSKFLWCAYFLRGKEYRESTYETDPKKAERYLKRRIDEVGADRSGAKPFIGPAQEHIKISCSIIEEQKRKTDCKCLMCALERDFRLRDKASPQNLSNIKRVRKDFALQRAIEVTSEDVDKYIELRRIEGCAPASINRTTQTLAQAYNLAIERNRLSHRPMVRHLSEKGNERKGFFEGVEFYAVVENLPADLQDFVRWAYLTGWRKGEIRSLGWDDVDSDVVRLRAEDAKNGIARSVAIEGELLEIIERRRTARLYKKGSRLWYFIVTVSQ